MASFPLVTTLLVLFPFLFSTIVYGYSLSSIKSWCNQTPYPQTCEYYLTNNAFNQTIKNKSDFFKVSLQLAIQRAQKGEQNTHSLGPKCRNAQEKAAWSDCVNTPISIIDHNNNAAVTDSAEPNTTAAQQPKKRISDRMKSRPKYLKNYV